MTEKVKLTLDDGSGKDFDEALRDTLKDGGDLHIITKHTGTKEGRPIAILTFTVEVAPGVKKKAQTVTTVRNLLGAADLIQSRYYGRFNG